MAVFEDFEEIALFGLCERRQTPAVQAAKTMYISIRVATSTLALSRTGNGSTMTPTCARRRWMTL
jgi:hypothetical protein